MQRFLSTVKYSVTTVNVSGWVCTPSDDVGGGTASDPPAGAKGGGDGAVDDPPAGGGSRGGGGRGDGGEEDGGGSGGRTTTLALYACQTGSALSKRLTKYRPPAPQAHALVTWVSVWAEVAQARRRRAKGGGGVKERADDGVVLMATREPCRQCESEEGEEVGVGVEPQSPGTCLQEKLLRTKTKQDLKQLSSWCDTFLISHKLRNWVSQIRKEVKYFQLFQGGWPIHAVIKQYLRNTGNRFRRDIQAERNAEEKGLPTAPNNAASASEDYEDPSGDGVDTDAESEIEMEGTQNDTADELDEAEDDLWAIYDANDSALADDSGLDEVLRLEMATWEETETTEHEDSVLQKPHKQIDKENQSATKLAAFEKPVVKKKPKPAVESESFTPAQKRKLSTEEVARKKFNLDSFLNDTSWTHFYQAKLDPQAGTVIHPPSVKTSKTPLPVSTSVLGATIPTSCPASYCKDIMPNKPTKQLLLLFAQKQELVLSHGKDASGARELNRQICSTIREENRRVECLQEARSNRWPLNIDFDALATRIQTLKLEEQIFALVMDPSELQICPIWQSFLEQISYKVHAFGRAKFGSFCLDADRASRCGYFGPRGKSIIISVVTQYLKEHIYSGQLCATIAALRSNLWDASNSDGKTIPPYHFIHYILAPDYGDLFNTASMPPLANIVNSVDSPAPASRPSVRSFPFVINHFSLIVKKGLKCKKINSKARPSTTDARPTTSLQYGRILALPAFPPCGLAPATRAPGHVRVLLLRISLFALFSPLPLSATPKTKKPVGEDENTMAREQGNKQSRDEKRTLQQHHKHHVQKLLRLAADGSAAGHGDAQSGGASSAQFESPQLMDGIE
ncbi:hypothetical protein B0H14DRAFT_2643279 [Mycena olivaceomarginata]|nr:hypothetical protein B0H14DRAFT_2643279 [Mycena olivaceomarginata]